MVLLSHPPLQHMAKFNCKFTYLEEIVEEDDSASEATTLEPEMVEPEIPIVWNLRFHRQNMTEFVSMTNGLDPGMQLGIPIKISLPERPRSRGLFDLFKSHTTDHHELQNRRSVLSLFRSQP